MSQCLALILLPKLGLWKGIMRPKSEQCVVDLVFPTMSCQYQAQWQLVPLGMCCLLMYLQVAGSRDCLSMWVHMLCGPAAPRSSISPAKTGNQHPG